MAVMRPRDRNVGSVPVKCRADCSSVIDRQTTTDANGMNYVDDIICSIPDAEHAGKRVCFGVAKIEPPQRGPGWRNIGQWILGNLSFQNLEHLA